MGSSSPATSSSSGDGDRAAALGENGARARVWVCCSCKGESGSSRSPLNRNEGRKGGEAEWCGGHHGRWG
jgi:hypothetical protein